MTFLSYGKGWRLYDASLFCVFLCNKAFFFEKNADFVLVVWKL